MDFEMKLNFNLRTFLAVVVILGITTWIALENFLRQPIEVVNHVVIGQLTTGTDSSISPLTIEELRWAVANRSNRLFSLISTASIEEYEKSTQLPREIPLIGLAELHRTIFKCDVEGLDPDGTPVKRTIYVEQNHFHLVDVD